MNGSEHVLLRVNRKNMTFASFGLVTYGIAQIFIALFGTRGDGVDLLLYAFGCIYTMCGVIGMLSSRGNGFLMIKCFRVTNYILIILNCFLVIFCVICCILIFTHYGKKCKKNSEFCEEKRLPDDIGLVVLFAIPVLFSIGSIVYLKLTLKFAKLLENEMCDAYNRIGFIPHSV